MKTGFLASAAFGGLTALMLMPGAAAAQSSSSGSDEAVNGASGISSAEPEIIVTATRRATRLQETPIAITAIDGDFIGRNNIREFSDFANTLANVQVPEGLNGGGNSITIRGITAQARRGAGIEQPAGAYLDQVYVGPRGFLDNVLFDIDRVEVLRGPQGTLWGRNTASGAISYTTRRPTDAFDGYARAVAGNHDLLSLEGAVSGPIVGDQLLFRLSGAHYERDGYTKNINGGTFGTENQDAVRGQLAFKPNEDFSLVLIGQYLRSDRINDAPIWYGLPGFNGPPAFNVGADFRKRRAASNQDRIFEDSLYSVTAIADYKIADFTLTSVTGYFRGEQFVLVDDDSTSLDLAELRSGTRDNPDDTNRFTQELRVSTPKLFGFMDLTAGVYYFNEETKATGASRTGQYVFDTLGIELPLGARALDETFASDSKTKSYATFGQANFNLTDKFTFTAGYRFNREIKKFSFAGGTILYGAVNEVLLDLPLGPTVALDTYKDNVFTHMLGLNYKPSDDIFLYATYSEGYKSGGFNTESATNPEIEPFFGPENVQNYEIGARTRWFDRRLTLNLTAFYMDYTDLQVEIQGTTSEGLLINQVANAGRARSKGVELDGSLKITGNWDLSFAVGILDAKFTEFDVAATQDLSGNKLPFAPEFTSNLSSRYDFALSDKLNAYVQGDWSYTAGYFLEVTNRPRGRQDGYHMINGRIALESADKRWEFGIWGRNLTDELVRADYNAVVETSTALFRGSSFYVFAPPRTFGADLAWRF